MLEKFLTSPEQVFMLKGYAGSGKTTILKGLVEYLNAIEKDFGLMAPTGRAAKVIREKTGKEAYTIHKSIYSYDDLVEMKEGDSFMYYYKIRNNNDVANKIFIVDESSMLSDVKTEGEFFRFGTGYLLTDLITYTRVAHENVNSKIIFVGDPCQLPPVGDNNSKAFDPEYLFKKFSTRAMETEIREVKRQKGKSGILHAAEKIRKSIKSGYFNDFNLKSNGIDVFNPSYANFFDTWKHASSPKIIIASKNKTCHALNTQIRVQKFGLESMPIQKTDVVIMGGNNYRKGIFNGEFAVINDASQDVNVRTITMKGSEPVTLIWRDVELLFPDAENSNKIIKAKILENFLYGENQLHPDETRALYVDFRNRHKDLKPGSEEFKKAILEDEYFNCLLIKYAYVVTCHKAQGGEWENVFTVWDHDITPNFDCFVDQQKRSGKTNQQFYRWAYTAITRAYQTLYALNPPFFSSYSSMSFIEPKVINALNELTGTQLQTEEISIDKELMDELKSFNLLEEAINLQDHFIKIRQAVRKRYIDIVGWEKINYEIRYAFKREQTKAVYKTFINGKNEFKNSITPMHNLSPDKEFTNEIDQLIKTLPNLIIKRNAAETIINKIEFDLDIEEKFPFTKNLFEDIGFILSDTDIQISDIEHQQYKERYTFIRNQEITVIDFEYNGDGFFGRVLPIEKQSNSETLITDIQQLLHKIKQETYAG